MRFAIICSLINLESCLFYFLPIRDLNIRRPVIRYLRLTLLIFKVIRESDRITNLHRLYFLRGESIRSRSDCKVAVTGYTIIRLDIYSYTHLTILIHTLKGKFSLVVDCNVLRQIQHFTVIIKFMLTICNIICEFRILIFVRQFYAQRLLRRFQRKLEPGVIIGIRSRIRRLLEEPSIHQKLRRFIRKFYNITLFGILVIKISDRILLGLLLSYFKVGP